MSFLSPAFLWLVALAAPLVALYFFRQRQEPRLVPTNFLWAAALRDTRTAAVWRKFLKSLLLLLQILVLLLATAALAGATATIWSRGSSRLVVALLDRSASMQARDGPEGRTRLDLAKEALAAAADGLREADRMMVVAVDRTAEVLVPFTDDAERIRAAVEAVEARDLPTDLSEAAVMVRAQATAAAGRDLEVLLLSDGAFADPGPMGGVRISFVPFGGPAANQGLTDLKVVRGPGAAPSLFVSVEGFGDGPWRRTVALRRTGSLLDAREARGAGPGQAVVTFPLEGVEPGPLEVALDGEDALAADDRAWLVLRPDPPRRCAFYGRDDPWIRRALSLRAGLLCLPGAAADAAALRALGPLDLVVYDGGVPEDRPAVRAEIFVGCLPPEGPGRAAGSAEFPPILDWARTHPVTRHCEFSDLLVAESVVIEGIPAASVLVDSPRGPLVAWLEGPDRTALVLAFPLAKSNLPLKLAFPLLVSNALDALFSSRRAGDEEEILRTGEPLERRPGPGGVLRVGPPGGKPPREVAAGPDGRAAFRETFVAGLHAVTVDGKEGAAAVSLLSRAESDIAPRARVEAGGVAHAAKPEAIRANRVLRDPLLLAALGLLLLEWLLWTRRR